MATSPTVLADASTPTPLPPAPTAVVAAKFPIVPLLLAVVVGIVIAALGLGGVVYYLARSGRLPSQSGAPHKTEAEPVSAHVMALEPMLVNLADASGSSYLRVVLTLRVLDASEKKDEKPKEEKSKDENGNSGQVAAVRDTVLTVLGRQTAEGLLAVDGKERLKAELKSALTTHNPDLKVSDVFFTDYLVQR
jgi:flagellar protein FliL